jgi:hypothetical protein
LAAHTFLKYEKRPLFSLFFPQILAESLPGPPNRTLLCTSTPLLATSVSDFISLQSWCVASSSPASRHALVDLIAPPFFLPLSTRCSTIFGWIPVSQCPFRIARLLSFVAFSSFLPTAFTSQSKKAKASAEGDDVKVEKVEISYGPKGVKSGEQVFGIAHIYASFNDTFVVRRMNAQHSLGRAH